MTKQEIINKINTITRDAGIGHCGIQYTNRTKSEFQRLLKKAFTLVEIKKAYDLLVRKFTTVEIGLAALDGTKNEEIKQIFSYNTQILEIIDELKLG